MMSMPARSAFFATLRWKFSSAHSALNQTSCLALACTLRAQPSMVAAVIILLFGLLEAASAQGVSADAAQSGLGNEAREALGDGVVGYAQPAWPLNDPTTIAQWAPGEWRYLITAGPRRGQIERERLARVDVMTRGETWKRTVGQEYTLHLSQTSEGSLVLPSEVAHGHKAVVQFEPPLSYLIVGLAPWETRVFAAKMEVYSSSDPATKWYSGRIRATTTHAGAYQVTTPAGTFPAVLIRTDYRIDILGVVSVKDTLHTFYAEGVGKVAEVEHRRVSMGLFKTDTKVGKVLLSFTPASRAAEVQSP
jgi:hypothetical protein